MKKALILGLGVSGTSAAFHLRNEGWHVVGVDKESKSFPFEVILDEEKRNLPEVDLVVKSPGIPWSHSLLCQAKKKGIPITSEFALGIEALHKKGKKIFGITGSNGKTTTTLLTTHLLNHAGISACSVGNVGKPLLSSLDEVADFFICEVSSFQLEELNACAFEAASILNITPNHLDRYSSFDEYAKTKFRIASCIKENGKLFLHEKTRKDFSHLIFDQNKVATIIPLGYRVGQIGVTEHDLENLSAACALLDFAGVPESLLWEGVKTFVKPPHRIELVRVLGGVKYVNDSKATSTDAVLKALQSCEEKLILIAGGYDKNGAFAFLGPHMQKKVKKLLLIGSGAQKMAHELKDFVEIDICDTLNVAVKKAREEAREGECVLFSPGCASYDQFKNYEHRGDVFKQLVNELVES